MAGSKKFYWLKLKNDFFNQKEIKKLRRIAGGDTYTIIYLKMQLLSLKDDGKIYFDGIEDSFAEELALDIDEDPKNVEITLLFLEKCGFIEKGQDDEYFLPQARESLGAETASAARVRKHRNNVKTLQCNATVTNCNTEIEIEKEIDIEKELEIEPPKSPKRKSTKSKRLETPTVQKHQYAEFVAMTNDEYKSLVDNEHLGTQTAVNRCIEILDNYKGANGKKYKSDYRAILTWVIDRYREEQQKQGIAAQRGIPPNGSVPENPQAAMARRAIELLKKQEAPDGQTD